MIGVALFAVFPTQPLYSANQNTKFLYGLAKAGVGNLRNDWLISQDSELPIFDALVYATGAFGGQWLFYVWQVAAMALYATATCGIARLAGLSHPQQFGRDDRWFLPIFAAWFLGLNCTNATGRLFEGVAHQYINGPVFEPASFGVLCLFGLLLFRLGQSGWAVVLIVAAAWVHPVYAITGLMLLSGVAVAAWRFKADGFRLPIPVLCGGVVGCLGAAAFAYSLLQPSEPNVQARAFDIITRIRIPQHSIPAQWFFDVDTLFKVVVVGIALYLARRDPLGWVLGAVTLAIAILSLDVAFRHDTALALAAPWRASAIVVPAADAIVLGRLVQLAAGWARDSHRRQRTLLAITAGVLIIAVGFGIARRSLGRTPEPPFYAWIRGHSGDVGTTLTPVDDERFRLATGEPQYVTWKTHPHRGASVLEWYRRLEVARALTAQARPDCDLVAQVAREGVTHLVRRARDEEIRCPNAEIVYRDAAFVIAALLPAHR